MNVVHTRVNVRDGRSNAVRTALSPIQTLRSPIFAARSVKRVREGPNRVFHSPL
jgi:hypothetical protein